MRRNAENPHLQHPENGLRRHAAAASAWLQVHQSSEGKQGCKRILQAAESVHTGTGEETFQLLIGFLEDPDLPCAGLAEVSGGFGDLQGNKLFIPQVPRQPDSAELAPSKLLHHLVYWSMGAGCGSDGDRVCMLGGWAHVGQCTRLY